MLALVIVEANGALVVTGDDKCDIGVANEVALAGYDL